jgi:GNAT superfamily N-acetyltransferase
VQPVRAWQPERQFFGPTAASAEDVEELNRVFADAFTDRYRRDGLVGVRVPHLNPVVWRYALLDAGEGAMVWRDDEGDVVAFNVAHRSGSEGWMGPLAVRPDCQGVGLGKTVVRAATDWLLDRQVTTLGLETMPRTVENIGFYSRLGFVPGHLTVTMTNDIGLRGHAAPALLSGELGARRERTVADLKALVAGAAPGLDFTREIALTHELEIGDATLLREGRRGLEGFALWHSAALADGRPQDEVRVLKLQAADRGAFDRLMAGVEASAARLGIRRVAVRCQTRYAAAYRVLVTRGYRVRWTDLRMTYDGYPEPETGGAILFSNWEI